MGFEDVLRREAIEVIAELTRAYASTAISHLPDLADAVEASLPTYLAGRLRANCTILVVNCRSPHTAGGWHQAKGLDFEIVAGERLGTYEQLDVAFLRRDFPRPIMLIESSRFSVSEPGRYRTILVEQSDGLPVRHEEAARLAGCIVNATYRWVHETVLRLVKENESDLIRELYALFRAACLNERLRDMVILGAVAKERVVYLLDSVYTTHALALASNQSSALMSSPARIVAEIITQELPYDVSFSREAVRSLKPVVVDLSHTKYELLKGPLLPRAEAAVIGARSVVAHAIVRDGDDFLLAVAPGDLKRELVQTLETVGPHMAELFAAHQSQLTLILKRLRSHMTEDTAGTLAHLAGRFLGGMIHGH